MGLPLYFWHREFFKQVAMLMEAIWGLTRRLRGKNLQWALVLVRANGREVSGKLQVVIEDLCFIVYLWWELLPWVAMVMLNLHSNRDGLESKI